MIDLLIEFVKRDSTTFRSFLNFWQEEIIDRSDFLPWLDTEGKLDELLNSYVENDEKALDEIFTEFESWHILELESKPSKRKALDDLERLLNIRRIQRYAEDEIMKCFLA